MIVENLSQPLQHRRLLLVEDAPENRFLFAYLLEESGATVELAEHGAMALEKIRMSSYDLVLMDINMPVMDGVEAMKILAGTDNPPPVIALTAYEYSSSENAKILKDFHSVISKPIEPTELINQVAAALN